MCAGSYTLFSASAAGGTWSVASTATASVSSTGNVLGIMPGSDSVYYALTNTCGNYSNGRPITVMAAPDAAVISGPSSVCMGATISLSPSALGGVWSRSNFSASVAAGNVTGVAAGTDTMYYTLTNRCGGTRSAAVVTVHAAPYAGSISGFSTLCTGVTDTLVSTVTGGRWVSTAPGLASVDSGAVTATAAGSVTLYYIVGNACGADTAAATVTLYAAPVAGTITGADSVCAGSTLLLAATEAGGTWNAHSSVLSVRGGTVTGINAGIDTVFYSVTNMCGTASAAHPVRVLALPLAGSLSGPSGLCRGAAITLSPTASGGVWTNADTAISTVVGGTVTGLAAGRDTIFYSVTNSCGTA
ncbi:MAG: hypothetical protein EBZ77_08575, partial [Chitinophagia bacterium]|nr:hypothetical protein [Chitinophagia bacterium]